MSRLFVAVWLPPALTRRLRAVDRPPRDGLRWTTEDQWHVTLRFLGEVPSSGPVGLALGSVASRFEGVTASLGPRPAVLGGCVWVLPVSGLDSLASAVLEATSAAVPDTGGRPFRGHVTLARARRPGGLTGLPAVEVSGEWTVDAVTLVCSHLRRGGARYEVVDRWTLGKAGRAGAKDG
ncbi:MAG TPA: 2'-5' RNA ligase family protein [Acidimicrobiales bacterium]|nr:2'-5' RNA ligase family protein [Acidimicrobiales bacterium]